MYEQVKLNVSSEEPLLIDARKSLTGTFKERGRVIEDSFDGLILIHHNAQAGNAAGGGSGTVNGRYVFHSVGDKTAFPGFNVARHESMLHGNGDSRYFVGYKWTVPEHLVHSSCAVRITYNMTSSDYDAWCIDHDAKKRNDRLARTPSTHEGQCYAVGTGPARIGGIWFSEP